MTVATNQAEIAKFEAEAAAYRAEAKYHDLQSDRIIRATALEDARQEANRIIDFTAEISYGSVHRVINTLSEMRNRDPEKPICMNILSPGGDVIAGLALVDYIKSLNDSNLPVTTVAIGMAASMGAVLLQAGATRLITPNAFLMVHEVSVEIGGKMSEIIDETKFATRMQDRLLDLLAERATIARSTIKRKWKRTDWWMDADEAISLGFADGLA